MDSSWSGAYGVVDTVRPVCPLPPGVAGRATSLVMSVVSRRRWERAVNGRTADERTTGNVAAARELALRLPNWTIWYGLHTHSFWALPTAGHLAATPHVEAPTAQELESTVRHMEYLAARAASPELTTPYGGRHAEHDPFHGDPWDRPPGSLPVRTGPTRTVL